MDSYIAITLFGCFFVLVFIGVPISFSIGIATVASMHLMFPWDIAAITVSQRLANGLDNFALLAIPFFIFAGTLMNSGGIAIRLINLAQVMVGRVPGSLGHVNVLANMMFGSISGSAVAAAAAVGGTLNPIQTKQGYDPAFSTAVTKSDASVSLTNTEDALRNFFNCFLVTSPSIPNILRSIAMSISSEKRCITPHTLLSDVPPLNTILSA